MHDFTPQANSSTCISFRAGQVIHVINRDPSGWWDGELDGKRGWFPSNYVSSEDMLEKLVCEEVDSTRLMTLTSLYKKLKAPDHKDFYIMGRHPLTP
jgi:hypothetical protein